MEGQTNPEIGNGVVVEVTVTQLSGASMHFNLRDSDTISVLKSHIEHAGGPPVSQQKIFDQGTLLLDGASFNEMGISLSVQLTMVAVKKRYAGVARSSNLGQVGTVGDLFAESFSVEAWVRIYQFNTANQGDNAILGCLQFDTNKALVCQLRGGTPMIGFYYNDTSANKKIDLNTWTYLTFTYDIEAARQAVYIDGVLSGSRNESAPLVGNYPVYIGEWAFGGRYLNGEIALLNIWDRAFSSEETVRKAMKAPPLEGGCIPEGIVHSFTFAIDEGKPVRIDAVTGSQCSVTGEVVEIEDFPV